MTTTNRWLIRFRCNFGIREMYHRFTLRLLLALICRQKVVVIVHRAKKATADSTKTYSRRWFLRDVQLMLPFHDKTNSRISAPD
jgi:hypothetical protein